MVSIKLMMDLDNHKTSADVFFHANALEKQINYLAAKHFWLIQLVLSCSSEKVYHNEIQNHFCHTQLWLTQVIPME